MPNPNGTPSSLVPAEPGNLRALKHGLWSDRALADEIEAEREALLALPWVKEPDTLLVDEIARLRARIAAVDADLDSRGHYGRNGARSLLDVRTKLNGALLRTLAALGATPSERSKWAQRLGEPSFAERVEIELRKIEEERDARH
jgi:hypothetical protein